MTRTYDGIDAFDQPTLPRLLSAAETEWVGGGIRFAPPRLLRYLRISLAPETPVADAGKASQEAFASIEAPSPNHRVLE